MKRKLNSSTIIIFFLLVILLILVFRLFIEKQQYISKYESPPYQLPEQYPVDLEDNQFKVIVYYPDWVGEQFEKLQFDIITHIMYAFAIPCEDGSILPFDNEPLAKELIQLAHDNNTYIMLSVGGYSYQGIPLEDTFKKATSSSQKINNLVDSIVTICLQYGFDGIDLDWEYPKNGSSKKQYEKFVTSLSQKLHENNKFFSAAVISGISPNGEIYKTSYAYSDKAIKAFDFISIMAYDGEDGEGHSPYLYAIKSAEYWLETRKVPKEKLVLGVPFYARPSFASYEFILGINPQAYQYDESVIGNYLFFYNGIQTIKEKTAYAKENLSGVMVWEITGDTLEKEKSLLSAIGEVIE